MDAGHCRRMLGDRTAAAGKINWLVAGGSLGGYLLEILRHCLFPAVQLVDRAGHRLCIRKALAEVAG